MERSAELRRLVGLHQSGGQSDPGKVTETTLHNLGETQESSKTQTKSTAGRHKQNEGTLLIRVHSIPPYGVNTER